MKVYDRIRERGTITEREILLVKNRLNKWVYVDIFNNDPLQITPEQTKKGYDWLWNLYMTPKGKVRKRNPFKSREISILRSFKKFELIRFRNCGNNWVDWYMPVYRVWSKHDHYFDYVVTHVDKYTNILIVG